MKKLISMILLTIVITIVPVYASDIDLASMETSELLDLRESINTELNNRNAFEQHSVSSGTYVVGQDISPGWYLYTNTSEKWTDVTVYENQAALDSNANTREDGMLMLDSLFDNGSATIHLEENNILVLHGEGTIERTSSLMP